MSPPTQYRLSGRQQPNKIWTKVKHCDEILDYTDDSRQTNCHFRGDTCGVPRSK